MFTKTKVAILERLAMGDSWVYSEVTHLPKYEKIILSKEFQKAAKEGIINCLTSSPAKLRNIDNIGYIIDRFQVPQKTLYSLEVQQAVKAALIDSLAGLYRDNSFSYLVTYGYLIDCSCSIGVKLVKRKMRFDKDVQVAAKKGIVERLRKDWGIEFGDNMFDDFTEVKNFIYAIKYIVKTFGITNDFYSSAELKSGMKSWILRYLNKYERILNDRFSRHLVEDLGHSDFWDQEEDEVLSALGKNFEFVKKYVQHSSKIKEVLKKRKEKIHAISEQVKNERKNLDEITKNYLASPF